jgi:hypothetical protein
MIKADSIGDAQSIVLTDEGTRVHAFPLYTGDVVPKAIPHANGFRCVPNVKRRDALGQDAVISTCPIYSPHLFPATRLVLQSC